MNDCSNNPVNINMYEAMYCFSNTTKIKCVYMDDIKMIEIKDVNTISGVMSTLLEFLRQRVG